MFRIASVGAMAVALGLVLAGCAWSVKEVTPSGILGTGDVQSQDLKDQFIVVLRDDINSAMDIANELKKTHSLNLKHVYEDALKGFSATIPPGKLKKIQDDPRVVLVEPDQPVYTTSVESQGMGLVAQDHIPGEIPTGVNRIDAERNPTTGAGINVAVLDTGLDFTHPDLVVNYYRGVPDCYTPGASPIDRNGHGTHMGGIIGAKDDGTGAVGVAPSAKLIPIKVTNDQGIGSVSALICGVNFVASTRKGLNTADDVAVAAIGVVLQGSSSSLQTAITNATALGIILVTAAGDKAQDGASFVPGAYPQVLDASAMADFDGKGGNLAPVTPRCLVNGDDKFLNSSNFGSVVDLAAPGACVYSTWKSGGYAVLSGTAAAAAHVAGVATLYVAIHGLCYNATCVSMARSALMASGKLQSDPFCGFTGDPSTEPLVYANATTVGGDGTGNCQ